MRTPRKSIWVAAVCGLLLAGQASSVRVASPVRPALAADTVAPDEATASADAEASGVPVEALSDRTQLAQVFANPDGSFTYDAAPIPQRFQLADGSWTSIDTTLSRQADGTVAPAASPSGLVLSGGGSGPMLTETQGGHLLSLNWPDGALPTPVLSASTATYPSVLPGVDLEVTATPDGASEVLVVHSASAAANPALSSIAFSTSISQLSLAVDTDGGATATDPATGAAVFDLPEPLAWDSAGGDSSVSGPGATANLAPMPVAMSSVPPATPNAATVDGLVVPPASGSLTVTPSATLLSGSSTVYPIYIDPSVTVHGPRNGWLDVGRNNAGGSWGDYEPSVLRVGAYCQPDSNGNCVNGSRGEYRSYLNLPVPSSIWDAEPSTISPTLFTNENWSWTCSSPTTVELWQTGYARRGDTWTSQPSQDALNGSQTVAYGNTCPDHGVSFNATAVARSAAAGHWSNLTLELKAGNTDEKNWNVDSWKHFHVSQYSDPYLQIRYDHAPDKPSNATTLDGTRSIGCGSWTSTTTPSLQARVTDPDRTNVRMSFHYAKSTGSPAGTLGPTSYLASGSTFTVKVPSGILTNGTYSWYSWGNDGTISGGSSTPCSFSVDTAPPARPAIGPPTGYSGTVPVGSVAAFTLSDAANQDPTDGVNDVVGYRYGFTNPPLTYVTAGTDVARSATVGISPVWIGDRTLYVQAVDRAGNLSPDSSTSPPATFTITSVRPAGNPTPLLAEWPLTEGSGTAAADATGHGHGATLAPQAGWGSGRVSGSSALSLTGAGDSEASTAAGIPPVDNSGSFTVSAWVKLSPATACRQDATKCGVYDAVSMDGVHASGFTLEYVPPALCNCWAFTMPSADSNQSPANYVAEANTAVAFDTWVHLVGVFDQPNQRIYLYVNGRQVAVTDPTKNPVQPWQGGGMGSLRLGRVLFNDAAWNWWPGEVSDVCTFWGALDAVQVSNVYNGGCAAAGAP